MMSANQRIWIPFVLLFAPFVTSVNCSTYKDEATTKDRYPGVVTSGSYDGLDLPPEPGSYEGLDVPPEPGSFDSLDVPPKVGTGARNMWDWDRGWLFWLLYPLIMFATVITPWGFIFCVIYPSRGSDDSGNDMVKCPLCEKHVKEKEFKSHWRECTSANCDALSSFPQPYPDLICVECHKQTMRLMPQGSLPFKCKGSVCGAVDNISCDGSNHFHCHICDYSICRTCARAQMGVLVHPMSVAAGTRQMGNPDTALFPPGEGNDLTTTSRRSSRTSIKGRPNTSVYPAGGSCEAVVSSRRSSRTPVEILDYSRHPPGDTNFVAATSRRPDDTLHPLGNDNVEVTPSRRPSRANLEDSLYPLGDNKDVTTASRRPSRTSIINPNAVTFNPPQGGSNAVVASSRPSESPMGNLDYPFNPPGMTNNAKSRRPSIGNPSTAFYPPGTSNATSRRPSIGNQSTAFYPPGTNNATSRRPSIGNPSTAFYPPGGGADAAAAYRRPFQAPIGNIGSTFYPPGSSNDAETSFIPLLANQNSSFYPPPRNINGPTTNPDMLPFSVVPPDNQSIPYPNFPY